ncbi:MAG: DUF6776 family protein [Pseudomonadota bacterium]|nr:DUF6776 family protein [Pseudomonadota bacterium]
MKWFTFRKVSPTHLVLRAHDPVGARRQRVLLVGGWLLSSVVIWLMATYWSAPNLVSLQGDMRSSRVEFEKLQNELERSEQALSISEKSDQVSRTANESLQATLRAQEDEIAGLRSDIAFFQRLMDGKSGRKGLTVQDLSVRAIEGGRGYNVRATLTQNLRKGEVTRGTATISIEGMQEGRIVNLAWDRLSGGDSVATPQFSFKYFQQMDSSFVLPADFTPNRIKMVVKSEQGDNTEQTLAWSQALSNGEKEDVWQ